LFCLSKRAVNDPNSLSSGHRLACSNHIEVPMSTAKLPTVKMFTNWLKMPTSSDPARQPPAEARFPHKC
jgi:hypothetical protein